MNSFRQLAPFSRGALRTLQQQARPVATTTTPTALRIYQQRHIISATPPHLLEQQPTARLPFSTARRLRAEQKRPAGRGKQEQEPDDGGNPQMPVAGLRELGLGRKMRVAVVVIACAIGTLETWVYGQAAWRWWKARGQEEEEAAAAVTR